MSIETAAQNYARFFETLDEADLPRLHEFFAPDARFKDPFNDVRGVAAITAVFRHMFDTCRNPRFEVTQIVHDTSTAYLHWRFHFEARRPGVIEGVSRVLFDTRGRAIEHVDYWDTAEQLYMKLPVLGWIFAWLRGRLGVGDV